MNDKDRVKFETVATFENEALGIGVHVTLNSQTKNPIHRYMIRPFTRIKPRDGHPFTVSGYQPKITRATYDTVALDSKRVESMMTLMMQAELFVIEEVQKVVDAEVEDRRVRDEERAARPSRLEKRGRMAPRVGKTQRDREKKRKTG